MKCISETKSGYQYNGRVPKEYQHLSQNKLIAFPLNTDSKKQASRLALLHSELIEVFFLHLSKSSLEFFVNDYIRFAKPLLIDHILSNRYCEIFSQTLQNPTSVAKRLLKEQTKCRRTLNITEALNYFWEISKNKQLYGSSHQLQKYKCAKLRTTNYFVRVVGNKDMLNVTRSDVIKYRDWWIDRIKNEGIKVSTVNREIHELRSIFHSVSDDLGLNINTNFLFRQIALKNRFRRSRIPFEKDYIKSVILDERNHIGLPDPIKWILFVLAETGARASEITDLLEEDIMLNEHIPYINICDRPNRPLKTAYSARKMPLVGFALDAFLRYRTGFGYYYGKADKISQILGEHFNGKKLYPSDQHSTYSLRHSFQDRLLNAGAPDRVQADLMGHKFMRPVYGEGASMTLKLEWMKKIQVKDNNYISALHVINE